MFSSGKRLLVAALLVGSALGCGTPEALEEEALAQQTQEMVEPNGLSTNGLSSSNFSSWFNEAPALRNELMKYLIGCALPQGEVRTYTDPNTGVTYS